MDYNTRLIGIVKPILNIEVGKKSTASLIKEALSEEHEYQKNKFMSSGNDVEKEILKKRLLLLETYMVKPDLLTIKENPNWDKKGYE